MFLGLANEKKLMSYKIVDSVMKQLHTGSQVLISPYKFLIKGEKSGLGIAVLTGLIVETKSTACFSLWKIRTPQPNQQNETTETRTVTTKKCRSITHSSPHFLSLL